MGFKKHFTGKGFFKNKHYIILHEKSNAYLLSVKDRNTRLCAYQVLDKTDLDLYPDRMSELVGLNVFRTINYKEALKEYEERNIKF